VVCRSGFRGPPSFGTLGYICSVGTNRAVRQSCSLLGGVEIDVHGQNLRAPFTQGRTRRPSDPASRARRDGGFTFNQQFLIHD
jgi:hypothetical protein